MAPRSSSAAMRSIRRELQRRRPRQLAPARPPSAKKTSATPPSRAARHPGQEASLRPRQDPPSRYASLPASLPPLKTAPRASSSSALPSNRRELAKPPAAKKTSASPPAAKKISATPPAAKKASETPPAAKKTSATPPAAKKTSATPPTGKKTSATPPAAKKTSSAAPPSRAARDPGRETSLPARTRTATLRTGQVLVLWLKAVVVSATEGGYEIVYEGGWPRDDPCATVQVARDHVRLRTPTPSTTPPPPQPPSCASRSRSSTAASAAAAAAAAAAADVVTATPAKKMKPAPRPTTAGKSVRVVRKLFPELFHGSDATASNMETKAVPRPTTAGKSIRLVHKLWPETERPPRPMLP
ncbi:hypothetical protein ACP4OV_007338 [Aristida adscensionis]